MSLNNSLDDSWIDMRGERSNNNIRNMRIRRCSFCRCINHTVNNCTSPLLINFENCLIEKKNEINQLQHLDINSKIFNFERWLWSTNNTSIIKAYAVQKCGGYMRDSIVTTVVKISNYCWFQEREMIRQQHRQGYQSLRVEFNNLANVLLENHTPHEEMLEGIMTWIIDRRPDYSILNNLLIPKNEIEKYKIIIKKEEKEEKNVCVECFICFEQREHSKMVKLNCNHEFCGFCVKQIFVNNNKNKPSCCAFCREKIESIEVKNEEMEKMLA